MLEPMDLLRRKSPRHIGAYRRSAAVTIRWATPADARLVAVLAELDDAHVPPAPLLLAFVGEELWVAASPGTGALISDPFRPAADVSALVRERGRQLTVLERGPARRSVTRLPSRVPETS
jgi:hypothetical protein